MLISPSLAEATSLRRAIRDQHRADETQIVNRLLEEARQPHDALDRIAVRARALVEEVRRERIGQGGIDAFLHEFELSSKEGVVLMCLGETKVNQKTVTHVSGDVAFVFLDNFGTDVLVGPVDLSELFGVDALGKLRGSDKVTEHDG